MAISKSSTNTNKAWERTSVKHCWSFLTMCLVRAFVCKATTVTGGITRSSSLFLLILSKVGTHFSDYEEPQEKGSKLLISFLHFFTGINSRALVNLQETPDSARKGTEQQAAFPSPSLSLIVAHNEVSPKSPGLYWWLELRLITDWSHRPFAHLQSHTYPFLYLKLHLFKKAQVKICSTALPWRHYISENFGLVQYGATMPQKVRSGSTLTVGKCNTEMLKGKPREHSSRLPFPVLCCPSGLAVPLGVHYRTAQASRYLEL